MTLGDSTIQSSNRKQASLTAQYRPGGYLLPRPPPSKPPLWAVAYTDGFHNGPLATTNFVGQFENLIYFVRSFAKFNSFILLFCYKNVPFHGLYPWKLIIIPSKEPVSHKILSHWATLHHITCTSFRCMVTIEFGIMHDQIVKGTIIKT